MTAVRGGQLGRGGMSKKESADGQGQQCDDCGGRGI